MSLKYPNSRLLIHELLAKNTMSVPEAIARAASEYGVIDSTCIEEVKSDVRNGHCPCMSTARNIVFNYFKYQSKISNLPEVDIGKIWSAIEHDAEVYERRPGSQDYKSDRSTNSHNCKKFAPVIFDLMLQQIRRYP